MDAISQTTFSNAFSWTKMFEFRLKNSLKFVPKGPINNIPTMVQIMAWRRPSDKPLSEPMMVSLSTHICVARPQWVNHMKSIKHPKMRKIDENEPWCGSIPRIYRHIIKWHNISSLFSVSASEKQCLRGKRCWGSLSNKDPTSQRPSVVWSFSPRHYWVWCFAILVDLQYSGRLATQHRGWWATFYTYL